MNNTRIYEADKIIPNRTFGYAKNAQGEIVFSDQSITSATKGDGCVYTSLNDYKKWFDAIISNKLINLNREIEQIYYSIEETENIRYGLGWFNKINSHNKIELYHTGSTCGFSNFVNILQKKKYLIVCFTNLADNHSLESSIRKVLEKYKINETEIDFNAALKLTR